MKRVSAICTAVVGLAFAASSHAVPFNLTAQLTGDPRTSNPDNIVIDVSITGDTESGRVDWVVDLNSPLHPYAALDTFSFNVLGVALIFDISQDGWQWDVLERAPGSGNTLFGFEVSDGPGRANNVTNDIDLSFSMLNLNIFDPYFSPEDFLNAPESCSRDQVLGCGQLGAHVRGLGSEGGDSGFAMGYYDAPPSTDVPEPTTLGLLGLGLLGFGFARRKRS